MTPTAYESELAERANERLRQEAEARKAAREAFLAERIAEMPKRDRPTLDEEADLLRRLLEAQDKADRGWSSPGTVSFALFSMAKDGKTIGSGRIDEVDSLASGRSVHAKMVRAEIEAACAKAGMEGAPSTLRNLAQIPASVLPPGLFARVFLALAWPEVRDAWQRARKEREYRRGPLATDLMHAIGRKVPLKKNDVTKATKYDADAGEPSRVRVTCAAGQIDLFHPAVVEQAGKNADDVFRAMAKVLGPRTLRTLWTCIDAVQRHEPDILKSSGDFLYTPGAFADIQRPRREKATRHDKAVIEALDEDMRRLAQTSVEWTIKAGNKPWTINAHLLQFQNTTLTQGKKTAPLPKDEFGPTREKIVRLDKKNGTERLQRRAGRRPTELWRVNPTLLKLMQTAGTYFLWDPAVLRTSPEATTLYLDLVARARMKPQATESRRLVESIVKDTGVVRHNPHNPARLHERLNALLAELREAGVLFGRLDGERVIYTLPPRHAAAFASIPAKHQAPKRKGSQQTADDPKAD